MSKSVEESLFIIFKDDPEIQNKLKEKLIQAIDDIEVKNFTKAIENIVRNAIEDDEEIYDVVMKLSRKIIEEQILKKLKV